MSTNYNTETNCGGVTTGTACASLKKLSLLQQQGPLKDSLIMSRSLLNGRESFTLKNSQ